MLLVSLHERTGKKRQERRRQDDFSKYFRVRCGSTEPWRCVNAAWQYRDMQGWLQWARSLAGAFRLISDCLLHPLCIKDSELWLQTTAGFTKAQRNQNLAWQHRGDPEVCSSSSLKHSSCDEFPCIRTLLKINNQMVRVQNLFLCLMINNTSLFSLGPVQHAACFNHMDSRVHP